MIWKMVTWIQADRYPLNPVYIWYEVINQKSLFELCDPLKAFSVFLLLNIPQLTWFSIKTNLDEQEQKLRGVLYLVSYIGVIWVWNELASLLIPSKHNLQSLYRSIHLFVYLFLKKLIYNKRLFIIDNSTMSWNIRTITK